MDTLREILDKIPADLGHLKQDLEKHIKLLISDTISKAHLVTDEEFFFEFLVQKQVLAKTRAKLTQLEDKVKKIETQA